MTEMDARRLCPKNVKKIEYGGFVTNIYCQSLVNQIVGHNMALSSIFNLTLTDLSKVIQLAFRKILYELAYDIQYL